MYKPENWTFHANTIWLFCTIPTDFTKPSKCLGFAYSYNVKMLRTKDKWRGTLVTIDFQAPGCVGLISNLIRVHICDCWCWLSLKKHRHHISHSVHNSVSHKKLSSAPFLLRFLSKPSDPVTPLKSHVHSFGKQRPSEEWCKSSRWWAMLSTGRHFLLFVFSASFSSLSELIKLLTCKPHLSLVFSCWQCPQTEKMNMPNWPKNRLLKNTVTYFLLSSRRILPLSTPKAPQTVDLQSLSGGKMN